MGYGTGNQEKERLMILHCNTKYETPSWYCRRAVENGKSTCPSSKSVHEHIIQGAFLEMYRLLANNFDDVLESVLDTVKRVAETATDNDRLRKAERVLGNLEGKQKKLTDLLLEEQITKEVYDDKFAELCVKITKTRKEVDKLQTAVKEQEAVGRRINNLKKELQRGDIVDEFDRLVFESIVDKVIVGETEPDGSIDPYKLTFVLKGNGRRIVSSMDHKSICSTQNYG